MIKKLLLCSTLLAPGLIFANPSPLGITIGEASCESAVQKLDKTTHMKEVAVSAEYPGIKKYVGDATNLPLEHATKIYLSCSKNNKVAAMNIELNKGEFSENYKQYYQELSKKYQLVHSENPFVGNKFAIFKSGDSIIQLVSPHMSFKMNLLYATSDIIRQVASTANKKALTQKKVEEQNL